MAQWPFSRARVAWLNGNRIEQEHIELIDDQQAQAADGLIWSDLALIQNWMEATSVASLTTNTGACCWDPDVGIWFAGADNGTNPQALRLFRSGGALSGGSVPAGAGLTAGMEAACIAPDGTWVIGGTPGSASAAKIRYATSPAVESITWASANTVDSGTAGVNVLHTFGDLIVAGLSDGDIETSPDGITWTARTEPNSNARRSAASSDDIIVVTANASTDKLISSPDGITWTERTLPAAGVWKVAYGAEDGVFLAVESGTIASSTNGTTWSSSGLTALAQPAAIAVFRKIWLVYDTGDKILYRSIDAGVSWMPVASFSGGPTGVTLRVGDNQILMMTNNGSGDLTYYTLGLGGR